LRNCFDFFSQDFQQKKNQAVTFFQQKTQFMHNFRFPEKSFELDVFSKNGDFLFKMVMDLTQTNSFRSTAWLTPQSNLLAIYGPVLEFLLECTPKICKVSQIQLESQLKSIVNCVYAVGWRCKEISRAWMILMNNLIDKRTKQD
jgi:hypothetical protein